MPQITSQTAVIGVIGHPIAHSFSPQMHNAAIRALGMDCCYVAFHVLPDRVGEAVAGVRALGLRGLNVTVPYKQAVMPFLDEISEEASAIGAVNTIALRDDKLLGYNTDVYGILAALRLGAGLDPLPEEVVVLGAGGAARGIVYALATCDAVRRITVLNRTVPKAERLAQEMAGRAARRQPLRTLAGSVDVSEVRAASETAGLIINATSVGMHPHEGASVIEDASSFHPGQVLFDTVYNPRRTRLMDVARSGGAAAYNGLDMLVYQGAKSFEIWTDITPPVQAMRDALQGRSA